jgi:type IV pilus assembly protein PilN
MKAGASQDNLISVSITAEYITILELSGRGENRNIEFFNSVKTPKDCFVGSAMQNVEILSAEVAKASKGVVSKSKNAIIAVSEGDMISQTFSVDKNFTRYDIENHLMARFEKYVTQLEMFDSHYDFYEMGISKKNPNEKDILLVVCKKTLVEQLEDVLSSAGLNPVSVDVDTYALERMVQYHQKSEDQLLAYIDVQQQVTNLHFLKNGKRVYLEESADFSLEVLSKMFGQDDRAPDKEKEKKAETIKDADVIKAPQDNDSISINFDEVVIPVEASAPDDTAEINVDDEEKEAPEAESSKDDESALRELQRNQYFYDFIQQNLDMFYGMMDDVGKIDKIVLAGDVEKFGIDLSTLSTQLDHKIIQSNPVANMSFHKDVSEADLHDHAYTLGVLVGLSLAKGKRDTHVNLHDWRTEEKISKNKSFNNTLGVYITLCALILGSGYYKNDAMVDRQTGRNAFVQSQIDEDTALLVNIEEHKAKKDEIIKRINTINNLQIERPKIVHLFTDIVRAMPKEIYLRHFERKNNNVILLRGVAMQDIKVFNLIKNIERSKWFYDVKITNIKSFQDEKKVSSIYYDEPQYEFVIEMKEENMLSIQGAEKNGS